MFAPAASGCSLSVSVSYARRTSETPNPGGGADTAATCFPHGVMSIAPMP